MNKETNMCLKNKEQNQLKPLNNDTICSNKFNKKPK
jgi:hypothetical protein